MRRRLTALFVIALGLAAGPAWRHPPRPVTEVQLGNPECGRVSVVEERHDPELALVATNRYAGEVILEMTYELQNLAVASEQRPLVLAPGETARLATFRVVDAHKGYRYQFKYQWNFGTPAARHAPGAVYRLPYPAGTRYPVIQGNQGRYSHQDAFAIDWSMPEGTPVLAARDGVVVAYHDRATTGGPDPALKSNRKVNWIYVRHDDKTIGAYYHLKPGGVAVKAGQRVTQGQVIGYSGNTGFSTGPHLHFEVYRPAAARRNETFPAYFKLPQGAEVLEQGKTYPAP